MIYIMYRISINNYTYIGSTKDLKQRKRQHKHMANNEKNINQKLYKIINENGGWENCEMIPIEEFNCENILQARIREEQLRKEYNPNMNTKQAHTTDDENKNRQNIHNNYYNNLLPIDCECGGKYKYGHINRHKNTLKHKKYLNL